MKVSGVNSALITLLTPNVNHDSTFQHLHISQFGTSMDGFFFPCQFSLGHCFRIFVPKPKLLEILFNIKITGTNTAGSIASFTDFFYTEYIETLSLKGFNYSFTTDCRPESVPQFIIKTEQVFVNKRFLEVRNYSMIFRFYSNQSKKSRNKIATVESRSIDAAL